MLERRAEKRGPFHDTRGGIPGVVEQVGGHIQHSETAMETAKGQALLGVRAGPHEFRNHRPGVLHAAIQRG